MEMEHINENLIKVMIDLDDLEERGIDFLDLIGDQKSIENFFYSILEEVDVHKHFEGSDAVTFQVMPNRDGLELYISRNDFDEDDEEWGHALTDAIIEHKTDFYIEQEKKQKQEQEQKENETQDEKTTSVFKNPKGEVIRFNILDDFINLAREIPSDKIEATLYQMDHHYYLVIDDVDSSIQEESAYNHFLAMMEYGENRKVARDVLEEYGQLIHTGDTLKFFGQQF